MAERKVLCKYYPPDFDPIKLAKVTKVQNEKRKAHIPSDTKKRGVSVRMMLPMSVRCNTCGEFMKIGTKFNMRKETVETENYLGIAIYRFYWKCKRCSGELAMKTDPKNADYICEFGATRNYEPWRDLRSAEAASNARKKLEEQNDIMKSLENKTYDSKREMDILDNLEEVRHLNKRHANVNHEEMIEASRQIYMKSLQDDVLEKDSKEQFGRLVRRRADIMEEDNRAIKEADDEESSDGEDPLGSIMNIKKREAKSFIKPNPVMKVNKFKRPGMKVSKKEDSSPESTSVPSNPLEMYADSDSD